jgi:hypothetical protein
LAAAGVALAGAAVAGVAVGGLATVYYVSVNGRSYGEGASWALAIAITMLSVGFAALLGIVTAAASTGHSRSHSWASADRSRCVIRSLARGV